MANRRHTRGSVGLTQSSQILNFMGAFKGAPFDKHEQSSRPVALVLSKEVGA